ncbi:MAG: flagellar biosynthesis protein FliR [Synergistaceae bacterium]|nr:flagellar biosynthesis protein FliR [Synergistaceae bacterium]
MSYFKNVPLVNIQALVALLLFFLSLFIANIVMKIQTGKWSSTPIFLIYLRLVLGFIFAASVGLAFYSFAGINILFKN